MAEKHKPAPMVDEISEFEILEIAVRELAIEKGLLVRCPQHGLSPRRGLTPSSKSSQ